VPTRDYGEVPATAATVYVCATSPDEVMRIGLQLLLHGHADVVLCLGRRSLLADALEDRLFDNIQGRLTVFGVLDAGCNPAALEQRALVERLARALHAQYLLQYAKEDDDQESHVPWERLDDRYRKDNRDRAEHIGRKLEEIDAVIVPFSDGLPPFSFRDDDAVRHRPHGDHASRLPPVERRTVVGGQREGPHVRPWAAQAA
jgi:hypothetical protein